jgi:putative endopeptidase
MLQFYQTGLGLPDRDYYFPSKDAGTEETNKKIRAEYLVFLTKMGTLCGRAEADAKKDAETIMALETELAGSHRTNVQLRDPVANYNKMTPAELKTLMPNFDWDGFFGAMHVSAPAEMNIGQPAYYKALNVALTKHAIADWKTYLRLHIAADAAPMLSSEFVKAQFELYGKTIGGAKEMKPRWKRVQGMMDGAVGELIGQMYVKDNFSPEAKEKAKELIANLRAALADRINALDWMSPATKQQALKKLNTIAVKVGYPDKWKNYDALEIKAGDFVGNMERASEAEAKRNYGKLGKPLDRTEWFMTPQTVNAYYNPAMNEIVFPAAILQPPFFDAEADDASNYGGIGAVIGHELTHGFDDQGRQFDEVGNLKDWWTKEDAAKYGEHTKALATQFSNTEAIPGLKVNGELTLGENIADLGGVKIAYEALQKALAKDPSKKKDIDGYTQEQRFFIAWAQVWATNYTDQALRSQVATNPHSPGTLRGYMPLTNLPEFYKAFNLKEGDKMLRPATERVSVW